MKKLTYMVISALLVCGVVIAGQLSTTWTLRNVVDPPDLRDGLNADAQAADARLDELDGGTAGGPKASLTVTGNITNSALTASKPVFTDANKALVSTGTLAADQGGTGAATLTDGGVLLGSAATAITPMAVLADGSIIVGDGATDPVALAAFSSSTGDLLVTAGGSGAGTFTDGGVLLGSGTAAFTAMGALADGSIIVGDGATDPVALAAFSGSNGTLKVANGGTALSAGTDGGVLGYTATGTIASSALLTQYGPVIGGGAGATPTAIAVGINNQVLKGATGAAPAFGALVDADVPDTITVSNYALLTQVWGSAGISGAPGATTNNVVTITANDVAGSPLAGLRLIHVWISDSDVGAATTNNIETLTLSTGTAVSTVTANADYWYVTAAAGTAVATIQGTALGTNYLMVADGSTVSSGAVVFEN